MKVGVPGEFHEDRWQRTAEDSERLCSRAHGKQAVPIEFKLSRGEGGFRPLFGTATIPTGTSEASSRSHCELVLRIVAELSFVKFTWHEPLLIIK